MGYGVSNSKEQKISVKFRYCEKPQNLKKISHLVLKLLIVKVT